MTTQVETGQIANWSDSIIACGSYEPVDYNQNYVSLPLAYWSQYSLQCGQTVQVCGNGNCVNAVLIDKGPAASLNRIADVSAGVFAALGIPLSQGTFAGSVSFTIGGSAGTNPTIVNSGGGTTIVNITPTSGPTGLQWLGALAILGIAVYVLPNKYAVWLPILALLGYGVGHPNSISNALNAIQGTSTTGG